MSKNSLSKLDPFFHRFFHRPLPKKVLNPSRQPHPLWTILALLIALIFISFIARSLPQTESFFRSLGIFGPFAMVILYGLLSLTPIPTDPFTLIGGALFGPLIGVLVGWIGNNLASLIEYYLGHFLGGGPKTAATLQKLPSILQRLPVDSPYFLILFRLIPGYGAKTVSVVAGVYRVPLRRYLWTAALTNLIGSILLTLGGLTLIQNASPALRHLLP